MDTGIRNFELCSIRDYDMRGRHVVIQGKGNKERQVPVKPFLRKYMVKYERMREGYFRDKIALDDYYFLSRTGRQLTIEATLRITKSIAEKAGVGREELRVSPHTCRHFKVSKLYKLDMKVLALRVLKME